MDELVQDIKKLDKVVSSIQNKDYTENDSREDYLHLNSRYTSIALTPKNFHNIEPKKVEDKLSTLKISFIDGGNSTLFDSPSFAIGFIRVAVINYSNNKRISRKSHEFYVLISLKENKYVVKTYPKTCFDNLQFDPEDESLMDGKQRCNPSRIISIIRRFAEIDFAYTNSDDTNIILLDGTLEARYPLEDKYLDKLFSKNKTCALSKTCSLVTKNGESIIRKLSKISQHSKHNKNSWYYHPIVHSHNSLHKADMYFIKLNNKSDYVFRFEIQREFSSNVDELMSVLSWNSNDPIFLGYPYGLIDVDQYARVNEEESSLLKIKFSIKLGKDWHEFSKSFNSTNAHTILDKIKF